MSFVRKIPPEHNCATANARADWTPPRSDDLVHLPRKLRRIRRWVLWRWEWRDGRWTKVPYIATQPWRRAAVNDPATWSSFEVVLAAFLAGHGDGVGIVLGDGIVGVDLDHVGDWHTEALDSEAVGILRALNSYTEISPSGSGAHVLTFGDLPPGRRRRGCVEMYDSGRFFTVTGRHVAGTPRTIEERTAALAVLHARLFPAPAASPRRTVVRSSVAVEDDATLLARAHGARNGNKFAALWRGDTAGYPSHSEADLALCSLLAFWTGGDAARIDHLFRASGLMRPKWDAPRGSHTYGEATVRCALRGWR
jgi:primase-polymerase (primpol)-like protein